MCWITPHMPTMPLPELDRVKAGARNAIHVSPVGAGTRPPEPSPPSPTLAGNWNQDPQLGLDPGSLKWEAGGCLTR